MFDRLGVPAAAFTAATAHAVAGEPGAPPSVTEGHLEGLVRVSLLVTEVADGATRYRQLHPVRTFARERLVARGEHDEICDRVRRPPRRRRGRRSAVVVGAVGPPMGCPSSWPWPTTCWPGCAGPSATMTSRIGRRRCCRRSGG